MIHENLIEFKSASMSYQDKKSGNEIVLANVDFTVARGELIYLIGKIGSGKSTLLKSIYGESSIVGGTAVAAGYDLCRLKRKDIPYLRRRLGIVFQDYQLLRDRTVYENLRFVLKATQWKNNIDINQRINKILEITDLSHKAYKMPHQLSGGEQQRLTIGRALLNSPAVIVADEPTGNLDMHATKAIMDLFMHIKGMGCSIIIATHDISIIEAYPGRTYKFNKGTAEEIDIYAILGLTKPESETKL